jgi:hypothetical protein
VEAVAAGDDVALELLRRAVVLKRIAASVSSRGRVTSSDLEQQRQAARRRRGDEVLHDLRLAVDDDRAPPLSSVSGT